MNTDGELIEPLDGRLVAFRRVVWLSACAIMVAAVVVLVWVLAREAQRLEAGARAQAARVANALQMGIGESLAGVDIAMITVASRLSDHDYSAKEIGKVLGAGGAQLPSFFSLLYIDPGGLGAASSEPGYQPGTRYTDRDYFRAHATTGMAGAFYSEPLVGRTLGKRFFAVSRAVRSADGSLKGVLMGSVEPGFLADMLAEFPLGKHGTVELVHLPSQKVVARAPDFGASFGRDASASPVFEALRARPSGSFDVGGQDPEPRIVEFHRLSSAPYAVLVSVSRADLAEDLWSEAMVHGASALMFVLLVTGISAQVIRSQRQALARLVAEEKLVGAKRRETELIREKSAELRENERFLSSLVENSATIIHVKDLAGRYLMVNGKFERTAGRSRESVIGKTDAMLYPPEIADEFQRRDREVLTTGRVTEVEERLEDDLGVHYFLSVRFPLLDATGQVNRVCCISTEITDRKRGELELRSAKLDAEAASVAKSRFLAMMSHEIRTPMNGILGMAEILTMPDLTLEERSEYAHTVLGSGRELLRLLNDVLDFSKVEAGGMSVESVPFDPEGVLSDTVALFHDAARRKGVELDYTWTSGAGHGRSNGCCYEGDPYRLRQILANLAGNAVKFTDRGRVHLEGREIDDASGGTMLEFSVTDTGIGIAPDKLDRLFEPFSQAEIATARTFGGSGLGLSIVQGLARLMGGGAGVESEQGQGSRFWIRIRSGLCCKGGCGTRPGCPEVSRRRSLPGEIVARRQRVEV